MTCDDARLRLFDDANPTEPLKQRRNPVRVALQRERPQLHLPVFVDDPIGAEEAKLEEFAAEHRPLLRSECREEARPCPWASCRWHLYHGRFTEFEAIVDCIPEIEPGLVAEHLDDAVAAAVRVAVHAESGDVMASSTTGKRKPDDRVPADALVFERLRTDDVTGPWPTCGLDVATELKQAQAELVQEDAAALVGITREAIRLMQQRSAGEFAADEGLLPLLEEITSSEKIATALEQRVEWYGDG